MRSDYCGSINRAHLQQTVTVFGWVHRRRDHGGVIFIDLRDRAGLLQVVCDPDNAATFKTAEVLSVEGAGHWVHHDRLDVFLDAVRRFI